MAFARHNIEKHRLIELVRMNPILWDCRLPHYKRSDKKKTVKWNELGRIFNVNGERVQRTFTSLREIFRRELNHEKLLGARFKSKWEYYEAMGFLKEVIRERKSRERGKSDAFQQQNSNGIDEYQYFAPNDPNNPNNQLQQQQQFEEHAPTKQIQQPDAATEPQQQQQQPTQQQQQAQQQQLLQPQQLLQLHPDVILNANAIQLQQQLTQLQKLSTNVLQQPQTLSANRPDVLCSSSNSSSSSPSIYIKDEPDSQDETISVSTARNEAHVGSILAAAMTANALPKATAAVTTATTATTTSSSAPKLATATTNTQPNNNSCNIINCSSNKTTKTSIHLSRATKQRSFIAVPDDLDDDDDDDVDEDDVLVADDLDDADDIDDIVTPALDDRLSVATTATLRKRRETPREILYTKFGDFLAARLNTLSEAVANDLMNKILMLIAEK